MPWRVDSMSLHPKEVPVLPRCHPQISKSFPIWIWQPTSPSPASSWGDIAALHSSPFGARYSHLVDRLSLSFNISLICTHHTEMLLVPCREKLQLLIFLIILLLKGKNIMFLRQLETYFLISRISIRTQTGGGFCCL